MCFSPWPAATRCWAHSVSLVPGSPKPGTVLQVLSHQCQTANQGKIMCLTCCPYGPRGFFSKGVPSALSSACTLSWSHFSLGAGCGTDLCWTAGGTSQTIHPACWGPSERELGPPAQQALTPDYYHTFTKSVQYFTLKFVNREVKQHWHHYQCLRDATRNQQCHFLINLCHWSQHFESTQLSTTLSLTCAVCISLVCLQRYQRLCQRHR